MSPCIRRWVGRAAFLVVVSAACAASSASQNRDDRSAHDVTFQDLQGRTQTLRPYAGKVIVLHVFATWDVPSLRSPPELNNLLKERKDVAVVGVGMDLEGALALRPFINTFSPAYPVWAPDEAFAQGRTLFGIQRQVPRFYIIGRDGSVRGGYAGYVPYLELVKLVDAELKRR